MSKSANISRSSFDQALHLLHELTDRVSAHVALDEVLDFVYDNFHGLIPYNRIAYSFVDYERQRLIARWARSDRPLKFEPGLSTSLAGSSLQDALEKGKPVIIDDLAGHLVEHPHSESARLIVEEGLHSSLACPLTVRGRPVGFLFFSKEEPHCYSAAQVELFEEIAGHLAWLIERSQLADDVRRAHEEAVAEREQLWCVERECGRALRELELAQDFQAELFSGALPQPAGYSLAAQCRFSPRIGGGFLDVLELAHDRIGIVLAELSEQGIRSIMLKAVLRAVLRLNDWGNSSAGQVLSNLHRSIRKCFPRGTFVTGMVAIFDPHRGQMVWSDARYPAPILVLRAGYTWDGLLPAAKGTLGDSGSTHFHGDCIPLAAGDKLVFCSPSLLRATGKRGQPFGSERLHASLHAHSRLTAVEFLERVWQDVQGFFEGDLPDEDLLAFVLERHTNNVASLVPPIATEFPWRTDPTCTA